jgi:hypothetical protein
MTISAVRPPGCERIDEIASQASVLCLYNGTTIAILFWLRIAVINVK